MQRLLRHGGVVVAGALVGAPGLVVLGAALAPAAHANPPASAVTEFQPNVPTKYGGRSISATIDGADVNQVLVATESGGLFRSHDEGATWEHVDAFPLHRMSDVKWSPNNPSLVVATTWTSGDTANPGGVWRSTDGGASWSRTTTPVSCGTDMNAWGIDFEPSSTVVYAGSNCGLLTSTDGGATFSRTAIGGFTHAVYAHAGGTVDVCSDDGQRRYTRSGSTLTLTSGPNAITAPGGTAGGCPQVNGGVAASAHDLAGVPIAAGANQLYVMRGGSSTTACGGTVSTPAGVNYLMESTNGGTTWTAIGGGCTSRAPWVVTSRSSDGDPTHFDIYYSGGLDVYRATCTAGTSCSGSVPAVGSNNVTVGHADPSQAVFDPVTNCARYVVSDGGVGKSTDCGATFPMVAGSGAANGNFNGLQVYEVNGQIHPGHSDYVFGTQDNSEYGSGDSGATWPNVTCCEGFGFQEARTAPTETGPLAFVACSACSNQQADPHLSGVSGWNNASGTLLGADVGYPYLLRPTTQTFVQWTGDGSGNNQLNLSPDAGSTWSAVSGATTASALMGHMSLAGPSSDPTLYQPVCTNNCGFIAPTGQLLKLTGVNTGNPVSVTTVPGITALGTYNDGNGSFRLQEAAFGVDPNNPLHLLAADVGTSQMKESTDGGATWTVDAQLTSLVTANGRFAFNDPTGRLGSQAHAIYFDPTNGNRILVGTESAGIIASLDGGQSWTGLPGSTAIPAVTSFFADEVQHTILVSSYGRGLWKLNIPTADLSVTKTHTPDPAVAGNELYYDVTVTNNGPDDASNVTVVDTLPAEVSFVSTTLAPPGTCGAVGQVVTCQVGSLSNGASLTFRIKTSVHTNAAVSGPHGITNTVSVSELGAADPVASNNTATDTVLVEDVADLQVTKICTPNTTVDAGQPITCTVTVDNNGPSDARSVVVDDTMLASGSFTVSNVSPALSSGTPGCSLAAVTGGQKLTCRIGNLAAATTTQPGRATVTYQVTATEGMDIDNVASTRSDTPDPDHSNDTKVVPLTIRSVADLSLTGSAPATATAGASAPVSWTLTATNTGPSTAKNVRIEDSLPAGVHVVSLVGSNGGTCVAGTPGDALRPAVCTFGDLSPGASRTMTVNVTVDPGTTGLLHNDGRVLSDTFDNDTSDNFWHNDITVVVNSDLLMAMSATPNPVLAGQTLTYKATLTDLGPSTATGAGFTVTLPTEVTFTGYTSSGAPALCGLATPTSLTCSVGTMLPGSSASVFVNVLVSPAAAHGAVKTASATATSTSTDAVAANNTASASSTVNRLSDLGVLLASDLDVYKPSTVIHYVWTVTNYGPSDAAGVRLRLTLPPPKTATFVSVNIPGCTGPTGSPNPVLTCSLGTVPAGGTVTAQVNVLIRGNKGTITSVAQVDQVPAAPLPDPVPGNNSSTRVVTVK